MENDIEKILNLSKFNIANLVAIDTEFSRERSFVPILSLVQIKYKNQVKIIDCINTNRKDIRDLKEILQNKKLIKIFHSYKQDIEAIFNYFGIIPKSCIDLQLIAKGLGLGDQVGYSFLVEKYKNIYLKKDNQRSNWLKRPLSEEQILYATKDVEYLIDIFLEFVKEIFFLKKSSLKENNKKYFKIIESLKEHFKNDLQKKNFVFNENNFWENKNLEKKIKNKKEIELARNLIKWRENKAFEINIPREFVVRTDILLALYENITGKFGFIKNKNKKNSKKINFIKQIITKLNSLMNFFNKRIIIKKRKKILNNYLVNTLDKRYKKYRLELLEVFIKYIS